MPQLLLFKTSFSPSFSILIPQSSERTDDEMSRSTWRWRQWTDAPKTLITFHIHLTCLESAKVSGYQVKVL